MSVLQPTTARDLFQRLAELQEVEADLSLETMARRVGAIVDKIAELAQANPTSFATELQDLDAQLAYLKQTGRQDRPLATPLSPTLRPARNS